MRSRPYSLYAADRFLSREGCRDLFERVQRLTAGGGTTMIYLRSTWTGNVRWARNEITTSGDTTDHRLTIERSIRGARQSASTNRLDDEALRACVQRVEDRLRYERYDLDAQPPRRAESYLTTNTWSDETFNLDAQARAEIQRRLVEPAIAAQMHAAGYLEVSAIGSGIVNSAGLFAYQPETRAEYSVTVRNLKGTASGWAGADDRDWRKIDAERLSATALDKCRRSGDPVAIEPGRYTVILEPQAVAELMLPLVRSLVRMPAESGVGPWADRSEQPVRQPAAGQAMVIGSDEPIRRSKIGQKVLDERITIGADPADPDASIVPFWADGTPHRAVKWIEGGVLKELAYDRFYALRSLNRADPLNNSQAFRMTGGQASVDDMIADTTRGLLITRFVNVRQVDGNTLLCTGTTADGVWLIERGRITTPVKNFRFRESPL